MGHLNRPYRVDPYQREPTRFFDTWQKHDGLSFASRQMLHNVISARTGGGKQKLTDGVVVPGTIGTSCTNTSVHGELAQSYWEKKGSASPLTGDCSTDAVHALGLGFSLIPT